VTAAVERGLVTCAILDVARYAHLPVLLPTKFDFVLNLNTVTALGLNV